MKKYRFIKSVWILLFCCFIFLPINILADEIESFDIKLDVKEDGRIFVDQKISYYFDDDKHGIYATIPQFYTMDWKFDDSKTFTKYYFFPVTNIEVLNENYEVDNEFDGVSIRIGDEDKTVKYNKDYHYKYVIKTKDLEINNKQILYFNLLGDKWDVDVKKINFEINMPKKFVNSPIFYLAKNNVTSSSNIKIYNNTISGSFSNDGKGIYRSGYTIYLDLDSNYFAYNTSSDLANNIGIGILSVVLVLVIILFFKYGKDKKAVRVINFYPPNNISSAEMAYLYKGSVNFNDVSSLFVYWASKQYVSIEECANDVMKITKVKEIADNENKTEIALFNKIFAKSNEFKTDVVSEKHYNAMLDTQNSYKHYYQKDKAVYEKKSNIIKYSLMLLIPLIFSVFLFINIYNEINIFSLSIILSAIAFVIVLALAISIVASITMFNKVKNKSLVIIILIISLLVLSSIYFAAMLLLDLLIIKISFIQIVILYLLMLISFIIDGVMDKRTEYGVKELGDILGFKEFIENAEKPRLEALVKDNPTYFYNILPYAYVLGISDIWIKKFENIAIPQLNTFVSGDIFTTMYMMNVFHRSMNHFETSSVKSIATSSGSGGGSFGGSGGGFGGGGFGGGGGGSW